MKKKNFIGLNIGSSSILVIFILLCLVTFATLSMVSANADYKLSQRVAKRTSAYYDANSRAQELLADADKAMLSCLADASSKEDYSNRLVDALADNEDIFTGYGNDTITIDYMVPITNTQTLHVTMEACYPVTAASDSRYIIHAWQVENTDNWNADDSIQLADPSAE